MKYLSHLDLARAVDRAVRRAKLPVAYSEGFHPHAQISFGPPLPLGAEGLRELCSVDLARVAPPAEMARALSRQLPAGLDLVSLTITDRGRRSPLADLEAAGWEIELAESGEALRSAVESLLAARELLVTRRTKSQVATVNIRPGLRELALHQDGKALLVAELSLRPETLVKPEEILQLLAERAGLGSLTVRRQVRTYLR